MGVILWMYQDDPEKVPSETLKEVLWISLLGLFLDTAWTLNLSIGLSLDVINHLFFDATLWLSKFQACNVPCSHWGICDALL